MKKTELQERVRESHAKLVRAIDGLTEEAATRTGLTSQWSIKDALAHIAAWEVSGARIITEIQQGTWQPQAFDKQAIDDFNARAVEERRERSMRDVRDEFDRAHGEMERVIQSLPDEVDEASPAYTFVNLITVQHHAHHAAQIEKFRDKDEGEL